MSTRNVQQDEESVDSAFTPFFGYPGGFCVPDPNPEYQTVHAPSNDVESEDEECASKLADSDSDDAELSTCCECLQVEDRSSDIPILLCDGCDAACHLSCAKDRPKLTKVPHGDWYCSGCTKKGSSSVAVPAVTSKRSADGGKKRKRNMNRVEPAAAAKKKSKATSERDLPQGVRKSSYGRFESRIKWRGKHRHIGTFDTPEQASAAYVFVKRDLREAKKIRNDFVVNATFNKAKKKAFATIEVPKKNHPKKVQKKPPSWLRLLRNRTKK